MAHRVHVGFGFHVNCYHSYRGDSPDEKGFGSDLRIIRGILRTLDDLNAAGVPVKGTWDSDNFFSLEQILPTYAPDILEGMRRRALENGDEHIIMGYSNGALGAMDEEELAASINLAVSNPQGSGLLDLFGGCERIVRPQEVMFSPSQIGVYNRLGVKALCLYYSCVPFDAFKTLIPPLPDALAFNPLTYEYRGDSLTVLPTYSNADVCDAGCLRAWVKELHEKQCSGEIGHDVFLFINMDADAVFWEPLGIPGGLANTGGIRGLAEEVADLGFVTFDTPGGYLKSHAPLGKISFTQDTADGNFTGYASWAEKPYNRKIWTAVERSRAAAKAFPDEKAFPDRVKLLSTTHFGLASPVLNIQRERTADSLAAKLTKAALRTDGPLTIYNITNSPVQCLQLACAAKLTDVAQLAISAEGLLAYTVLPMDETRESVFLMLRFAEVKKEYRLQVAVTDAPAPQRHLPARLVSGDTEIGFHSHGVKALTYKGGILGAENLIESYLTYGGGKYPFRFAKAEAGEIAGGQCVSLWGLIPLPGAAPGRFRFDFFTSDALPGIFVKTDVSYPYTPERDAISTENSTLGRFSDMRWEEAVPFALRPALPGELTVLKRNYMGDLSAFSVGDFARADAKNKALASFNHQLSAGAVGLTNGRAGLMLGIARTVLNSMAACPMRLDDTGAVTMNPFGTFTGPQRHHPNRSNDRIPATYALIAPQSKSLAPAYNGSRERALLCLLPFAGDRPEAEAMAGLLAFADGAWAAGSNILCPFAGDNVRVRPAVAAEGVKMRSPLFTGLAGNVGKYITRGARAVVYIAGKQRKAR